MVPNVPRARQALKKLLVDRMEFTPVPATNGKGVYRFRGELSYGAVIGATACVVSPAGFAKLWAVQVRWIVHRRAA